MDLRHCHAGCFYEGEYEVDDRGRFQCRNQFYKTGDPIKWQQIQVGLFHSIGAVVQDENWDHERISSMGGWDDRPRSPAERQEAMQRRDETWRAIAVLERIEYMELKGSIPPHGLEALRRFSRLRTLIMGPAAVPASLEPITELPELEHLELDASKVLLTTQAVEAIGRMPRLRHLGLSRTRLEEGHLRVLAETSQIESLYLNRVDITDGAVDALRGFSHLKQLSLRGTAASDSWGQVLGQLTSLGELDLSQTSLGPEIMDSLVNLPKLRKLNTSWTNITGRAIVQFQQQNPACEFVWDGDRYR